MFNRLFSGLNKKLAEQVVSKIKPAIDKVETNGKLFNVEAKNIENTAIKIGGVTGATLGAAGGYDKSQSTPENIITSGIGAAVGGAAGCMTPLVAGFGAAVIQENKQLTIAFISSVSLGIFGKKTLSALETKQQKAENANRNAYSLQK